MKAKINLILTTVIIIAFAIELDAQCTIINQSKYRAKDKKFGNIIFGTSLPYQKESEFKGISNVFTWGEFEHLEARAYFPCLFGQVCKNLMSEVVSKGYLTAPYIYSQGWELWIDEIKGDKVGEQLSYAGGKIDNLESDKDQLLAYLYDKENGPDFFKVSTHSYPAGIEYPFPDVCLLKPGKYHVQVQFYVQVKGNKGGGSWSFSEGAGTWSFNPAEGYINVGISGGEFTFIVK
ncbi:MAG: hypothetical protein EPN82_04525 [Bacteroidetes bacterium]|nr:MAG: hypothetical protein EPN82_04525 [Bacteroidota bacterium]